MSNKKPDLKVDSNGTVFGGMSREQISLGRKGYRGLLKRWPKMSIPKVGGW